MRPKRQKSSGLSSEKYAHVIMMEKRILLGVTLFTAIGFILWIVAVSTDYWFVLRAPKGGLYLNISKTYFLESNSGLWQICTTEYRNKSSDTKPSITTECEYHNLFPTRREILLDPEVDRTIIHYSRTETAFSIISVILMIMAHGFSFYTFIEQRYMFKRLAGGVYFLAAGAVFVVIEVCINSVQYEAENLPERHPKGADWHYGFSLYLACITSFSLLGAGFAFMACSRKRKEIFIEQDYHRRQSMF